MDLPIKRIYCKLEKQFPFFQDDESSRGDLSQRSHRGGGRMDRTFSCPETDELGEEEEFADASGSGVFRVDQNPSGPSAR